KQWCLGWLVAGVLVVGMSFRAAGQDSPPFPKPAPEFEEMKKLVGTWDCTVRFQGKESKGSMTYQLACSGMWLASKFDGTFFNQPFQGRGLDTYDAAKKKYVGIWVDSMATTPMMSEGTYDPAKKTLTMTSDYPGPDGKITKHKMASQW